MKSHKVKECVASWQLLFPPNFDSAIEKTVVKAQCFYYNFYVAEWLSSYYS